MDGRTLVLGVSRKEEPHLTFSEDKQCLRLNLKVMAQELKCFMIAYGEELHRDAMLREKFFNAMKAEREHRVENPKEKALWKIALEDPIPFVDRKIEPGLT